jgi:hypothetical protein
LIIITVSFITLLFGMYNNRLLLLPRKFSLIPNRINESLFSEYNFSLPAWINSGGIWTVPDYLYPSNFAVAIPTSKGQGWGTNGSAVCVSICLTSLTPCTFSSLSEVIILSIQSTVGICKQITIHILDQVSYKLVIPLYGYLQWPLLLANWKLNDDFVQRPFDCVRGNKEINLPKVAYFLKIQANHSPPSSVLPPYVFMMVCLIV